MFFRRILELIAFIIFWMLLVFKTDIQNLVAAAIIGLLTITGIIIGSRYLQSRYILPPGWITAISSLPWKIVTDTGRVFLALLRQIIQRDQSVGQLVSIPFDYGSQQSEDSTRLALTLFGISITPNTVAITTPPNAITVHQLQPTTEAMERRNPRWPV